MQDKVVEKVGNIEAQASLQPLFYVHEIDASYPKGHYLLAKKDNDDANQKHQDEALKDKAKSYNSSFADQPQT